MGWTSYHATHYKNGKVDRKAELDENFTWSNDRWITEIIKSRMVGSVYYAAVKKTDIKTNEYEIVGAVVLTCGKDRKDPYFNFGYKDMSEFSGPRYYDCPKSILDLLTPTDSEWALEWRQKCRENLNKPKLKDLPVGTEIKWTYCSDEKILIKMAPNGFFKRAWWYRPSTNTYVPSRRIKTWEVIK